VGEASSTQQEEEAKPSTSSPAIEKGKALKSSLEATSSTTPIFDRKRKGKEVSELALEQTPYMTHSAR